MFNTVVHNEWLPYDPKVLMYDRWDYETNELMPYICTNWREESLSWKTSCYLSLYLSGFSVTKIKGPDVEKMMNETFINNFSLEKFPVGTGKHIVGCAENGYITGHGVCLRTAEDEFELEGGSLFTYVPVATASGKYNLKQIDAEYAGGSVLQLAGPRSLEIVENVIKEDIHDLKFMRFRDAEILGRKVRVLRMGMGATLSYEIQGKKEDGHVLYDEIMRVGKPYDLKRIGHLIYMSNHTENGFPQNYTHFIPAEKEDPETAAYIASLNGANQNADQDTITLHGSMSDQGVRAYYANPLEVGWDRSISWSKPHFKGKEALLKIRDSKETRSVCTLEWNPEDILNIFRAFYDDDPDVPDEMVFPQNYFAASNGNLSDKVLNEKGELIGRSTGIVYTPYYKRTITQGYILPEYNKIGQEVTILWGTAGTRQIPIRAKVARFPYLDLPSNREYDVESIPRYKPE